MHNLFHVGRQQNEGVIGVLYDGARLVWQKRVGDGTILSNVLFEHISHEQKQVRGEGVTLSQSSLALNPSPRHAIHENCCST